MDEVRVLQNFRDLGGLVTEDGARTRAGVLYRSDAPYPGDRAPAGITAWPPAAVVDLRSANESGDGHPLEQHGTVVHRIPLLGEAAILTEQESRQRVSGEHMRRAYDKIVGTVPDRLTAAVRAVTRAAGPVLVHCAAGKDRTGITVAVLLLAAGVRREEVVRDYVATAPNMQPLLRRLRALGRRLSGIDHATPSVLGAPPELMESVIDRVAGGPGGVAEWLTRNGAGPGELRAWRERFVDG